MLLAARVASPAELRVIAGLSLFAGGFLFALAAATSAKVKRMRLWPTAKGAVTRSEVVLTRTARKRLPVYEFRVEYAYTVAGTPHVGTRVSPCQSYTGSREPADALCRKYPAGSAVTVLYNPRKPREAYLEATAEGTAIVLLFGALLLMLCLVTGLLSLANPSAS